MVRVSSQANMQAKWSHAKRIAYKQPCSCCCPSCGGGSSSNRGDAILSVARLRRLLLLPSSCSSTRCQVPESHTLNRPDAGVMVSSYALLQQPKWPHDAGGHALGSLVRMQGAGNTWGLCLTCSLLNLFCLAVLPHSLPPLLSIA